MKENHFCFIIPRTPLQHQNKLRNDLWEICKKSLIAQSYKNWTAIVIGPREEVQDDRFIFLEFDLLPKLEKVRKAIDFLRDSNVQKDYIIRLDDDDLFSEQALFRHRYSTADCIADRWHTFIEITTKMVSSQCRNWLANTVIHKWEHASSEFTLGDKNDYLLCLDHSLAWKEYYKKKRITFSRKQEPLYLRILSPTSITSTSAMDTGDAHESYLRYLYGFGEWDVDVRKLRGFAGTIEDLRRSVPVGQEIKLEPVRLTAWQHFKQLIYQIKSRLIYFR